MIPRRIQGDMPKIKDPIYPTGIRSPSEEQKRQDSEKADLESIKKNLEIQIVEKTNANNLLQAENNSLKDEYAKIQQKEHSYQKMKNDTDGLREDNHKLNNQIISMQKELDRCKQEKKSLSEKLETEIARINEEHELSINQLKGENISIRDNFVSLEQYEKTKAELNNLLSRAQYDDIEENTEEYECILDIEKFSDIKESG